MGCGSNGMPAGHVPVGGTFPCTANYTVTRPDLLVCAVGAARGVARVPRRPGHAYTLAKADGMPPGASAHACTEAGYVAVGSWS